MLPSWGRILPGGNATIHCMSPFDDPMDFYLEKDGPILTIASKRDRGNTTFAIKNLTSGGSFSCYYLNQSHSSKYSKSVELLILDPTLPRPITFLNRREPVNLGESITIYCQTHFVAFSCYLQKAEDQARQQHMETYNHYQSIAMLFISSASWEETGSYTCYCHNMLFVTSESSDPVELLITDPNLPRPNIFLSSRITVPRSNITIQCWVRGPVHRFYLHKAGDPINRFYHHQVGDDEVPDDQMKPRSVEPVGEMAVFHIIPMSNEDGGRYYCSYRPPALFSFSKPSDDVELWILWKDPFLINFQGFPFYWTSISLNTSDPVDLGGGVTIFCPNAFGKKCYLQKPGAQEPLYHMDTNPDNVAMFVISNASQRQRGNYSCRCHTQEPYVIAESSNPVMLVMTDPALPRPNISLSPSGIMFLKSNVTIHCQGKGPIDKFYLHKAGYPSIAQSKEPEGEMTIFSIMKVSQMDGGRYHCSYRPPSSPFNSSKISDDVELFILGPWLSRPTISFSPIEEFALGSNVTIYCQNQYWLPARKFYLQKSEDQGSQRLMETHGAMGKIIISNASLEDAGKYSCSFCPEAKPFLISNASDPMELLITDPDWPRPNISLSPGWMAFPGDNITIKCWVKDAVETFYLRKYGDPTKTKSVMPYGNLANFFINNVQLDDGGNYSCSYRPHPESFSSSKPSNLVQVFIFASHLPKPTISMSPSRLVALGGQVSIKCEIFDGPAEFFLHKAGDSKPQAMRNNWDVGEFSMNKVSWKHQGNYSCYFFNRFMFSAHSDSLELLVSDFTQLNIVRLATGSLLLLLLAYIIILDHRYRRGNGLGVR